jgi:hypothetical protein
MAAPKGNLNAARNGTRLRLPIGELPVTMRRQTQAARKYRRQLEARVREEKGPISASDAHLINEAATAEIHASVCLWLLRTKLDGMTVADVVKCSGEILKARTARNRAVAALDLDRDPIDDAITALYSKPDDDGETQAD